MHRKKLEKIHEDGTYVFSCFVNLVDFMFYHFAYCIFKSF